MLMSLVTPFYHAFAMEKFNINATEVLLSHIPRAPFNKVHVLNPPTKVLL